MWASIYVYSKLAARREHSLVGYCYLVNRRGGIIEVLWNIFV